MVIHTGHDNQKMSHVTLATCSQYQCFLLQLLLLLQMPKRLSKKGEELDHNLPLRLPSNKILH